MRAITLLSLAAVEKDQPHNILPTLASMINDVGQCDIVNARQWKQRKDHGDELHSLLDRHIELGVLRTPSI
jgi:hypothetical protein